MMMACLRVVVVAGIFLISANCISGEESNTFSIDPKTLTPELEAKTFITCTLERPTDDTLNRIINFYRDDKLLDCGSVDINCNTGDRSNVTYHMMYKTYAESGMTFEVYTLEFVALERLNGTSYHCRLLCGFSFCNTTQEVILAVQGLDVLEPSPAPNNPSGGVPNQRSSHLVIAALVMAAAVVPKLLLHV